VFSDKQHVKVQETPESVPEGETPQTIHLCAYEDQVDAVRPGDRIEITGIYKAMGIRVNQNKRTLKNVYRTYVDVMNYQKAEKSRFQLNDAQLDKKEEVDPDAEMIDEGRDKTHGREQGQGLLEDAEVFTAEDKKSYIEFSQRPDVYDLLVDNLAPSIWENEDVKKGILCQLFGGVSKQCQNG
jgi:DNA replication licensing factor MCM4